MDFSTLKELSIPEGAVNKIEAGGVVLWEKLWGYKNWVPYSTESDGKTIYNGGLGYKDGYRLRSGGAEGESAGVTITGFIPFVKGDKLYIYPPFNGGNTWNTVNFYDSSFAHLGQITDSGMCYGFCTKAFKTTLDGGVSVLDISAVTVSDVAKVAYVRIGNNIGNGDNAITSGAEMIITKNEEIVNQGGVTNGELFSK